MVAKNIRMTNNLLKRKLNEEIKEACSSGEKFQTASHKVHRRKQHFDKLIIYIVCYIVIHSIEHLIIRNVVSINEQAYRCISAVKNSVTKQKSALLKKVLFFVQSWYS